MSSSPQRITVDFLPRLGLILKVIGIVVLAINVAISFWGPMLPDGNVSLTNPQRVIRSPSGTFYVADAFLNRVQAYDGAGRFLRGWAVAGNGKTFDLEFSGDSLAVTNTLHRRILFDSSGVLLREESSAVYPVVLAIEAGLPGYYVEGNDILRLDSDGVRHRTATIEDPHWPLGFSMGFLLFATGVLLTEIARKRARPEKARI